MPLSRTRSGRDSGRAPQSRRGFLAGGAALIGGSVLGLRRAATAADKYARLANRTVTLVCGGGVGGGYDLCGRVLAQHMEALVPGLRFEVKNVTQASGRLAGKILQAGPTDGGMICTAGPTLLVGQLLREDGVAYDLGQWGWLGKVADETNLLVRGPGADFATLDELKAKKTTSSMATAGITSTPAHIALWVNAMLGLRIKPVAGYKASEKDTALMNGEVMITSATWPTDRRMLEAKDVDVFLRVSSGAVPDRFKDRPLLADLVADSYQPILAFIEAVAALQRWFAVPPNTDPEVLAEWRALFDTVTASSSFKADIGKLDFAGQGMNGAKVSELVSDVLADQDKRSALLQATLQCGQALADGQSGGCTPS